MEHRAQTTTDREIQQSRELKQQQTDSEGTTEEGAQTTTVIVKEHT